MRTTLFWMGLAAAVAACGGDDTVCGTGTTKQGNACVADNGSNTGSNGSGNDTSCGTGTHLMGTMCVPDDNTVAAAPTITMMDPAEAGIAGGGLFTITGTGFNGSNVTDLHVFFGDPTNTDCEATLGAASATAVSGQVPVGCTLSPSVTVTLTTNLGSATTPFNYAMIFAGDGIGGANAFDNSFTAGGSLYVIDPFAALSFNIGTPADTNSNAYSYGGMDFDSTGLLWAATTGYADSDVDGTSQLLSIDLSTGAMVVVDITDDAGDAYNVSDIKFVGGTLYAWADSNDGTNDLGSGLISIDTATGTATVIGSALSAPAFFGGLAVDGSNNLLVAPSGAAPDDTYGLTGELDTVNTMDGTLTTTATLDWYNAAPVQAMTTFPGTTPVILAVIDNGTWGPQSSDGSTWSNETLAVVDPTATSPDFITNALFELPGATGSQPHIDAIAVPPASLVLSRKLPRTGWTKLAIAPGGHPLTRR